MNDAHLLYERFLAVLTKKLSRGLDEDTLPPESMMAYIAILNLIKISKSLETLDQRLDSIIEELWRLSNMTASIDGLDSAIYAGLKNVAEVIDIHGKG